MNRSATVKDALIKHFTELLELIPPTILESETIGIWDISVQSTEGDEDDTELVYNKFNSEITERSDNTWVVEENKVITDKYDITGPEYVSKYHNIRDIHPEWWKEDEDLEVFDDTEDYNSNGDYEV